MSPFGPFYPPRLQASVNHAERLARLLLYEESRMNEARRVAAWLLGRAGEIELFTASVVEGWRLGRRPPEAAAAALDAYLASLHEGLAIRLGITGPSCCGTDAVTTQVPPRRDAAEPAGGLLESIDRLLMNLEVSAAATRPPTPGR